MRSHRFSIFGQYIYPVMIEDLCVKSMRTRSHSQAATIQRSDCGKAGTDHMSRERRRRATTYSICALRSVYDIHHNNAAHARTTCPDHVQSPVFDCHPSYEYLVIDAFVEPLGRAAECAAAVEGVEGTTQRRVPRDVLYLPSYLLN